MPTLTSQYKLPAPTLTEAADGPDGFSKLANAIETALIAERKGLGISRYRINDFNVANGATVIDVTLDGLIYQSAGITWAAGGKPIIPTLGRYLVRGSLSYAPAAGGERLIALSQNGASIAGASFIQSYSTAAHSAVMEVVFIGSFAANAQIGLQTWQSSGKTLLCSDARLSVDRIADLK